MKIVSYTTYHTNEWDDEIQQYVDQKTASQHLHDALPVLVRYNQAQKCFSESYPTKVLS